METLAKVCYIPAAGLTNARLRAQLMRHFDSQMMLIVDELQQISLAGSDSDRLKTVEFFREIFDRSQCGMVLCGTNEAMQEVESGPNALWMRQLRRRSLPKVVLPSVADDEDIVEFAAYFGLGEQMPPELVRKTRQIAADHGIGLLITYFQGAARMAAAERVPASWVHFQRTIKALANQGGKRPKLQTASKP